MSSTLQGLIVALIVVLASWQALGSLLPARRRQLQHAFAMWLCAPGRPRWARQLGLKLIPAAALASGCGSGCSKCSGCGPGK
jgi:hypothetical protein